MSADNAYRARVDAVLAQRKRLRGPQPAGDLFAGLPANHALLVSDARRPLEPNLEVLASYVEPDDIVVDVGGGAGRLSLPLALRCRETVVVDPSAAMLAGLESNAARAGIGNTRAMLSEWPMADPPRGTVALVNHVTYLTRDIVPFLAGLTDAAARRVLLTVGDPPPPSLGAPLFRLVHDEELEVVPGHAELVAVLREMGADPEVRVLSGATRPIHPGSNSRSGGRSSGDQLRRAPVVVLAARPRANRAGAADRRGALRRSVRADRRRLRAGLGVGPARGVNHLEAPRLADEPVPGRLAGHPAYRELPDLSPSRQ